jgi:hypothetical protein
MKIFAFGVIVIAILTSLALLYRYYYVRRRLIKLVALKHKAVHPLIRKLENKENVKEDEILWMAKDPSLRLAVYQILRAHQRQDLFPTNYLTTEKGAESFLVSWLEFPTELGTSPSEIVFNSLITIQEKKPLDYYTFKYRVLPPHWAARYDWMWGVSGPYTDESKPFDSPTRVYSRFNQVSSITAGDEVAWVHAHINN